MEQQVKERHQENRKNSKKGYYKGTQKNISATLIPKRFNLRQDSDERDKERPKVAEVPLKAITESANEPHF